MERSVTENAVAPPFFISYASQDRDYVTELAGRLRGVGLPAWYDADMAWGDQWPRLLAEKIRQAPGMIVVMSPAAAKSEWVEREILEGQHYNRPFRPILLDGERFFLLAATQFFDARDGGLPGEREITELRKLLGSAAPGARSAPPVGWGMAARGGAAIHDQDEGELLRKLRSFLAAGRVEHADILTTSMVLEGAGRTADGWLREKDGRVLTRELLSVIDRAWSEHTHGEHGFRAQLARYGAPSPDVRPGRDGDFDALAGATGWRGGGGRGRRREAMPLYTDFVRSAAGDRTPGFFPSLRNPQLELRQGWHDRWARTVMAVHLRLRGEEHASWLSW